MPAPQFPVIAAGGIVEARDYLVGSTYRKDALEGALWRRLRGQLIGKPVDDPSPTKQSQLLVRTGRGIPLGREQGLQGAQGSPIRRDPRSVLSAILSYTLGVVRWEPVNPIPEHRPCPSPGGRFTVDAVLSFDTGSGVRSVRHYPRDHRLVALDENFGIKVAPGTIAITLSSDLSRCASPYGDLAYCLSSIEAGAVLAQVALVLGEYDLAIERAELSAPRSWDDRLRSLTLHVPAAAIADWLCQAELRNLTVVEDVYPALALAGLPLLEELLDRSIAAQGDRPLFPSGLTAAWPAGAARTLMEATAMRSSGLDMSAGPVANQGPDRAELVALLEAATAIHAGFAGLGRHGVGLTVTIPETLAVNLPGELPLGPGSTLRLEVLPHGSGRAWGHVHPIDSVIVTISASYREYLSRHDGFALFNMYLATGVAAQIIALASASAGLVCRPMRSFDHAAADALLPIDQWSVLQLVIYADRASNPSYLVGAAS